MAPPKFYKIGEVMKYAGLSRQTVHNYTMLGLIVPVSRTDSGHRLYGEDVFDRLKRVEMLKRHRTLSEVKAMLDEPQPVPPPAKPVSKRLKQGT